MINILWDLSKIWRYCSGYMCVRSTRQVKDLHGFNSSPLLRCFGNAILASPNRSVFELKTACSLVHCGTKPTSGCHCKPHYMTYIAVEGTYIYKNQSLAQSIHLTFPFPEKNVCALQLPTHMQYKHEAVYSFPFNNNKKRMKNRSWKYFVHHRQTTKVFMLHIVYCIIR